MKKRFFAFLLSAVLLLPIFQAQALAADIPTAWKAPGSLQAGITNGNTYSTSIYFSVDSELLKFIDPEQTDHEALGINSIGHTAQIDWKLNNGAWHYTSDWDDLSENYEYDSVIYANTGYLDEGTTQEKYVFDLRNDNINIQTALGSAMKMGVEEGGDDNSLDLANNTFYFRVRVMVDYYNAETGEQEFILSPWSEVLAYGKSGESLAKPTMLTKPTISNPIVGANDDGSPKITFTAITPQQVQDANNYIISKEAGNVGVEYQININNSGWVEATAGAWWLSSETRSVDVPATYDNGKTVEIDQAFIQVRMRYEYEGGADVSPLQSEWSNIITVNTPAWTKASEWATAELQAADDSGLIPDILMGADMTKPITREEFAELAVLLYEKAAAKTATPVNPNPFTDTTNQQILKAFSIGVTQGMSATTFEPNTLINREQCAAMLYRTIKAIAPSGDYSIAGVKDFPDQKTISGWAVESTKYMSKIGIIKGDSAGNFMPKSTTSVQQAAGYGMATREAAILMSVRTFEQLK